MTKNIVVVLLSTCLTLFLAEGALRSSGRIPGQFRQSRWMTPVDSLYMLQGCISDENGIFKVDTAVTSEIAHAFREDVQQFSLRQLSGKEVVTVVAILFPDHLQLLDSTAVQNEFRQRFEKAIHSSTPDQFDSILINYHQHPINSDGFYSIPFNVPQNEGRKKVLLLGDSFTWGHSTQNKTSSFANTLLSRGYLVHNTGVSGADVAQYKQIAKTYLDSIRPDVVILNFYMGNDVTYYERAPESGVPIHYSTNAGNLVAFQDGVQFYNMQEAYDNIIRNMVIPQTTLVNRLAAKTVIGTVLWQVLVKLNLVEHQYFMPSPRPEIPYCNEEIAWIRQFCEARHVVFILSVIPNLNGNEVEGVESNPHLFEGISYHEPEMTPDMYNHQDGHFNEKGHLFYADFLENLIRE